MAVRATVKITLAVVLGALCLPCSAVGVGMMVAPSKDGDANSGFVLLLMGLIIFGLPSAILFFFGLKARGYNKRLQHVSALGMASQRLPLQQIATDLGVSTTEARQLVIDAVSKGMLVGRIDLEQGVFISGATHQGVRQVSMRCHNCGAQSTVVVTAGSISNCQFCGARLA